MTKIRELLQYLILRTNSYNNPHLVFKWDGLWKGEEKLGIGLQFQYFLRVGKLLVIEFDQQGPPLVRGYPPDEVIEPPGHTAKTLQNGTVVDNAC